MPSWLKGGILGILIGILLTILIGYFDPYFDSILAEIIIAFPSYIWSFSHSSGYGFILWIPVFSILQFFIVGSIISIIIGKIKQKKS